MSIIIHDGKSCPFPHWKSTKGEHNPSVMRRNGRVTRALPDPAAPGWVWNHATRGDDIVCYQMYGDISSGCPIDDSMPTTKNPEKPGGMFNVTATKPQAQLGNMFKTVSFGFNPTPHVTAPAVRIGPTFYPKDSFSTQAKASIKPPTAAPLFVIPPPKPIEPPTGPAPGTMVPMDDEWFLPPQVPVRNGWYEVIISRYNKEEKHMLWYSVDHKVWIRDDLTAIGVILAWRGMVKI